MNPHEPEKREAGFFSVVRAVLWSFLGIRKKNDYARDAVTLKPQHVIVAGLIGGVLLVLSLVLVVRYVVSQ